MTALAVACCWKAPTMWQPDPVRQMHADYTIDDVLDLPDGAPRVELVDGVMVVVPTPSIGHNNIGHLLWNWFHQNAPKNYLAAGPLGIKVTIRDTFELDVALLKQHDEPIDIQRHFVTADELAIVVEVVSPGTKKRDRLIKPAAYADVGIPYYWRIEQDPVHIFAYRLTGEGGYELAADSKELLELDEPFEIRLPIAQITP